MGKTLQPNRALEKKLNIVAVIVSIAVLALVGLMKNPNFKIDTTLDFSFLPPVHSALNALAAIALMAALYFIKNKNVKAHQNAIYAAMVLSGLFLLSYVVYHFTNDSIVYGDINYDGIRDEAEAAAVGMKLYIYLFFLITHVVLAGLILPFILITFNKAYTNQFESHRKFAKWVFPLWLYVAVTGPICYIMLSPYYPG